MNRDRIPIIVGGTGFWIDALIYDWPIPEVKPNRVLRARLEKLMVAQLFEKLKKLDPARAASIKLRNELNNKRCLIRALEIVLTSGQPSPSFDPISKYDLPRRREALVRGHSIKRAFKIGDRQYQLLILGIKLPQKELEKRIYKRLIKRLGDGLIEEVWYLKKGEAKETQPRRQAKSCRWPMHMRGGLSVEWSPAPKGPSFLPGRLPFGARIKKLHNSGVSWKRLDNFGLEYRYVSRYLRGFLTYDQMIEQLSSAIKKYAKRQMTWFKRNPSINWISKPAEAFSLARKFTTD